MRVACGSCGRAGYIGPGRPIQRPGPVWCFYCARPLTHVDVSPWHEWLFQQVERKRALQASGQLYTRKQSVYDSDCAIDFEGLAGELAACLLLSPGYLTEWQRAVEGGGNNRGRDLLPTWTAGTKTVEVKFTRYRDESRGYLLVRPPSRAGIRMLADFVDDCLYVLVQPDGPLHSLSGWVDRARFLTRKVPNPVGAYPGQTECWGVHWSRLEPLDRLPEPSQLNFAVLPPVSSVSPHKELDLWYGHSIAEGWVVVNWQDPRNRPGRSPRYLYMLRGQDEAEVRVRFSEWSPPAFLDAEQYLCCGVGSEQSVAARELVSLQSRVEGTALNRAPAPDWDRI